MPVQVSSAPAKHSCPPSEPLTGNVHILLDNGQILHAHRLHLEQASEIFAGALKCTQSNVAADLPEPALQGSNAIESTLPLPGITRHQAVLLLQLMYTWTRETWAKSLSLPDLLDLARVADQYACLPSLQLVDNTLVQLCEEQAKTPSATAFLTVASVPVQYQLALRLHLKGYAAVAGHFLGRHADEVDFSKLDPTFVHILDEANMAGAELLASMSMGQQLATLSSILTDPGQFCRYVAGCLDDLAMLLRRKQFSA